MYEGQRVLLHHMPFPSEELFYGPLILVFKRPKSPKDYIYESVGPFFEDKYPSLEPVKLLTLKLFLELTLDELILWVASEVLKHFLRLVKMNLVFRETLYLLLTSPKRTDLRLLRLVLYYRMFSHRFRPSL